MHKINAVALNLHDQNTYDVSFIIKEKDILDLNIIYLITLMHMKTDNDKLNTNDYNLNNEFVEITWKKTDDILHLHTLMVVLECVKINYKELFEYEPKKLFDFVFKDNMYYCDHHQSHATYAFINSGFKESDILAIDGIGAKFRCIFVDKDENIKDLSKELPIGWLWNQMSKLTGFGSLGASKLMGLVELREFNQYYYDVFETIVSAISERKNMIFIV